jgi:glycosyltransferase involved in cell wall biosynthesis
MLCHPMRVLEVTQSVSRLGGGLFESVRHLAQAIHCSGQQQVRVSALADSKTAEDIRHWTPLPVRVHKAIGPSAFGFSPGLLRELATAEADLVHLHGLWRFTSIAVRLWARRTGKPYIISPHGMLEPWALHQKWGRKQVGLWLFERRCLSQAACIRATSLLEARSIRQAGFTNRVEVVPNGIKIMSGVSSSQSSGGRHGRRALFLSRLHPKKGLINLVQAWAQVRPAGWRLGIAGPDEAGHCAKVRAEASRCGILDRVEFLGEVTGEHKARTYEKAELFVLPSFSENFGLVVAEALSAGVPVITTRATPWSELEEHRCGWWIETGIEPLANALKQATSLPAGLLKVMGERGRRLVQHRYDLSKTALLMAEVYDRLQANQ